MKEWLTKTETCQILGISKITLERMMKAGKIAYYKSGTSRTCAVRINANDLRKYIAKLKVKK